MTHSPTLPSHPVQSQPPSSQRPSSTPVTKTVKQAQGSNVVVKTPFIEKVDSFLKALCKQAHDLDQYPDMLRQAFVQMGTPTGDQAVSDRPVPSLLGLKVPKEWGGQQLSAAEYYQFKEVVARYSGALAFLQTQHQSAVSTLARCDNQALKDQYLFAAVQGQIGIGVGFSQLRRSGEPLVQAIPISGGYRISGQVPWITGYGCFQHFVLGATLPDGRSLFGLLPLETTVQPNGGHLRLSAPMELAAMMSTNTVKAALDQWLLPTDQVLDIKPIDWIHQSDRRNSLNHSCFALGCARAGLDIVAAAAAKPYASPTIQPTWVALDQQLTQCRQQIYQVQIETQMHPSITSDDLVNSSLQLRAEAIALAVRCAHAAVIVSRGAANSLNHPAQRVYREALAFSVFGQTTAVMDASLAQLMENGVF